MFIFSRALQENAVVVGSNRKVFLSSSEGLEEIHSSVTADSHGSYENLL
jgi:hypothetical protein